MVKMIQEGKVVAAHQDNLKSRNLLHKMGFANHQFGNTVILINNISQYIKVFHNIQWHSTISKQITVLTKVRSA